VLCVKRSIFEGKSIIVLMIGMIFKANVQESFAKIVVSKPHPHMQSESFNRLQTTATTPTTTDSRNHKNHRCSLCQKNHGKEKVHKERVDMLCVPPPDSKFLHWSMVHFVGSLDKNSRKDFGNLESYPKPFVDSDTGLHAYEDADGYSVIDPAFVRAKTFGTPIKNHAYVWAPKNYDLFQDPATQLFGYKDADGKKVIEAKYPNPGKIYSPDDHSLFAIKPFVVPEGFKSFWYILDKKGKVKARCFQVDGRPDFFYSKRSRIVSDDSKMGFIDLSGQIVIPPSYTYVSSFLLVPSMAVVCKGGKWSIPRKQTFDHNNLSKDHQEGKIEGGLWGLIGLDGKEIVPCMFEKVQVAVIPKALLEKINQESPHGSGVDGLRKDLEDSGKLWNNPIARSLKENLDGGKIPLKNLLKNLSKGALTDQDKDFQGKETKKHVQPSLHSKKAVFNTYIKNIDIKNIEKSQKAQDNCLVLILWKEKQPFVVWVKKGKQRWHYEISLVPEILLKTQPFYLN
jgi:hypothetical protein